METYDLMVVFADGTERIVRSITKHGADERFFYAIKNGREMFFPTENVTCFGSAFDFGNR